VLTAIDGIVAEQKVPKLEELILEIQKSVPISDMAKVFKIRIAAGLKSDATVPDKSAAFKMAVSFANMLKQYQQLSGEITTDEIGKMADKQIDALLRDRYGYERGFASAIREAAPDEAGSKEEARQEGTKEHGGYESIHPEEQAGEAGTQEAIGVE
jgi:hypothetical protein